MPTLYSSRDIKQMIESSFKLVDADRSGYLQKHELQNVLCKITNYLGSALPDQEDVDFIMKELDKNGDGRLSKEEFTLLVDEVLSLIKNKSI